MGNLLLTRKAGESVKIGDSLVLTLREVHAKKVYLHRAGAMAFWVELGEMFGCDLAEGGDVRVTIAAINHGRVRLMFEADKSIKILRTELLP